MGKNIIIQESGEPKTLSSIDKIITPKVGGGSAEWVLFENLDLMAKTITKNGTYKAEDDNVYGYHKVTVKVPKKGKKKTGKRPQSSSDPNDYCVTTEDDGQGGQNLVYTKLPTSINIINPPSKTTYDDGELIKKQGMLVKAYYADGGLWGDVPLGEITLDPDKASSSGAGGAKYISGDGINAIYIPFSVQYVWANKPGHQDLRYCYGTPYILEIRNNRGAIANTGGTDVQGVYLTKYDRNNHYYWAFDRITQGDRGMWWISEKPDDPGYSDWGGGIGSTPKNFYGGPYTVAPSPNTNWYIDIPVSTVNPSGVDPNSYTKYGGPNEITAKWNRPEDSKTLTDKFTITLAQ